MAQKQPPAWDGHPYGRHLPPYLTDDFIAQTLTEALHPNRLEPVKIVSKQRLDSIGEGFCSVIFDVEIEIDGKSIGIIAKFPLLKQRKIDQLEEKHRQRIYALHNTELNAYQILKDSGVSMPRFLGGTVKNSLESGVIVTERIPFPVTVPSWSQLSIDAIEDIIVALARLHYIGFKIDEKSAGLDLVTIARNTAHFRTKFPKMIKIWTQDLNRELPVKVEDLETMTTPKTWQTLIDNCQHRTLVHGDLWHNNILIRKEGENPGKLTALIDWQMAHFGSIGEDLARLLTQNCDHKVVDQKIDKWIDLYFASLCAHFRETKSEPPFGREFVVSEFEKFYAYGSIWSFFEATVWREQMEPENIPKMEETAVYNLRKGAGFWKKHGII